MTTCLLSVNLLDTCSVDIAASISHSQHAQFVILIVCTMGSSHQHTPRSVLDAFYKAETEYTYASPDERDFETIAIVLSPNFVMEQSSGLPYAGTYHGRPGMKAWMDKMAGYFDRMEVRDPEIFERHGSNRIVILSNVTYRIRASEREISFPFAQAMTVDLLEGQIREIRPFYWDVYALNRALGFSPTMDTQDEQRDSLSRGMSDQYEESEPTTSDN